MFSLSGNTVLITGGGSGIGRAPAEALHAKGNTVIISGRNPTKLNEVERANPGIVARELDVDDPAKINAFARQIIEEFPSLNVVVNNAGVMIPEDVRSGDMTKAEATISTNLLAPIRVTASLLPHLLGQQSGAVFFVSSGLASVPLSAFPSYCASKAAIHSYAESLRDQLRTSSVKVVELVPPLVQTELTGPEQAVDPRAMPLADYMAETMALLSRSDLPTEVLVQRSLFFRNAERENRFSEAFALINAH